MEINLVVIMFFAEKISLTNKHSYRQKLSSHIWDLKKRKMDHTIRWKLVDRAKPYSPVSGKCQHCIKENNYILFHPNMASLNSRSETVGKKNPSY